MSIPVGTSLDLQKNEIQNPRIQNLASDPSSPVEGQLYHNTADHHARVYDGTSFKVVPFATAATPTAEGISQAAATGTSADAARADHAHAMPALATTSVDGFMSAADKTLLTNATASPTVSTLAKRDAAGRMQAVDPSAAADVATKSYVDGLVNGADWKPSVRVATAVAGTLATSFANAQTVDGITLATGDRILIKNQAAPAENGIYTVNSAGAPTRALDMDAWTEVPGAACFVEVGTAGADTAWVCTADAGGTLGTTAIAWVQLGSAAIGANSVDNTKLAQMANGTIKGRATAGTGNPEDLTASQVRTILGTPSRYAATAGDGSSTSLAITHSLGSTDVIVQVWETGGSKREIMCEKQITSSTVVTLLFGTAPAASAIRVVVLG